MKRYNLNNLHRGLADSHRQPIMSNEVIEIDKHINRTSTEIKQTLNLISIYQRVKIDPSAKIFLELKKNLNKLYALTIRRIHYMHHLSEKAFSFVVKQAENIQKCASVLPDSDEWLDQKKDNIIARLIKRQKEKLAWQMEKLEINNHPIWHKAVASSLANLQQVGIYLENENSILFTKMQEYNDKRLGSREDIWKNEGLQKEISKSYGRLPQNPGDDIFVREKENGTDNRGLI